MNLHIWKSNFSLPAVLSIRKTKKLPSSILKCQDDLRQFTPPAATRLKLPQFPVKMFQKKWFEVHDSFMLLLQYNSSYNVVL